MTCLLPWTASAKVRYALRQLRIFAAVRAASDVRAVGELDDRTSSRMRPSPVRLWNLCRHSHNSASGVVHKYRRGTHTHADMQLSYILLYTTVTCSPRPAQYRPTAV